MKFKRKNIWCYNEAGNLILKINSGESIIVDENLRDRIDTYPANWTRGSNNLGSVHCWIRAKGEKPKMVYLYEINNPDFLPGKKIYFLNSDFLDYRSGNLSQDCPAPETLENPIVKNEYVFLDSGDVEIKLTMGKTCIVDFEMWHLVKGYRWSAAYFPHGKKWYAQTGIGPGSKKKIVHMHRMIMGYPKEEVDHRNHNGLDNRISNIRAASRKQNARNRNPSGSKYGYPGIVQRSENHFYAYCLRKYCGKFPTLVDAITARNKSIKLIKDDFTEYMYIDDPIFGRYAPGIVEVSDEV